MFKAFSFGCLLVAQLALANKDAHKNFQQMAQENGYASEQYTIVTQDGYVT